jgi:hypothetical protein
LAFGSGQRMLTSYLSTRFAEDAKWMGRRSPGVNETSFFASHPSREKPQWMGHPPRKS